MKIVYLNKVIFPSNMPSTVFSCFNAYGFALNDVPCWFVAKECSEYIDNIMERYFGQPDNENFTIKLFDDKRFGIKSNEIFYLKAFVWIFNAVKNDGIDTVITRDPGFIPYLFYLKKIRGVRAFYQPHNFYFDLKLRSHLRQVNKRKYSFYERFFLPRFDGLLAILKPQKNLYKSYLKIPVMVARPGLIKCNDLNVNRFKYKRLAYVGSFQPKKGIESIINLFAQSKKDWQLKLIGGRNSGEMDYVKDLVCRYDVEGKVKLVPWQSYGNLPNVLNNVSIGLVFLTDSFYNRYLTAPSKLFDYLANGIPIVGSDLPSLRDFIKNEKEGILVNPDDSRALINAIEALLSDEQKFIEMQKNCLKTAKKHTWKKVTNRMIDFMIDQRKEDKYD